MLHIAARSFNTGMNVWLTEPQRWSVLLGGDRINIWAVILGACVKSRKAFISFVMSVCPSAWNISSPTEKIFAKFGTCVFFLKTVYKIQDSLKSDKNNGYFT